MKDGIDGSVVIFLTIGLILISVALMGCIETDNPSNQEPTIK